MMKKLLVLFIAAVAACGSLSAEQADHWTLSGATMTDGVWTFGVSRNDTKLTLTVNSPSQYPDVTAPEVLDLSKPILNDAGTEYAITSLAIGFSAKGPNNNWNDCSPKVYCGSVSKLILPDNERSRITSITSGCFAYCTNLTEIVNYLPDSVTTIGENAFMKVPAVQPLSLKGIKTLAGMTFKASGITAVTFGPDLQSFGGGNRYRLTGCFGDCKNLSSVTFDPNMKNATLSGFRVFQGTALTELPNLEGFSTLSVFAPFAGLSFPKVTIPASATNNFNGGFFDEIVGLESVEFLGKPPETITAGYVNNPLSNWILGGKDGVSTYIQEELAEEWTVWAANGIVNSASSTWNEAAAGPNFAKRPLIYKAKAGDLGDWVYNSVTETISDGTWTFEAVLDTATQVAIGKCMVHPDVPSELDFTGTVSDQDGFPMSIVRLNTGFGEATTAWDAYMGPTKASESAPFVSSLVIPETVHTINARAFACCNNLTKVTPFLPETVTTLGLSAFWQSAVAGEVSLPGITVVNSAIFYGCTNLTSVVFGLELNNFECARYGSFGNCTALTNVVFSQDARNFTVSGYGSVFKGSTALGGTLDFSKCSGFSTGGNVSENCFSGTSITNLILGVSLSSISSTTLSGMNSLQSVEFLGAPPKAMKTPVYKGERVIVTCVHKAFKSDWAQYVDGGAFTSRKAFWSPDFIDVDKTLRPFLVVDQVDGLMLIVK